MNRDRCGNCGTPEAKAAEAIGELLDPEDCADCDTCAFRHVKFDITGESSCLSKLHSVILRANAAHYLPLLRTIRWQLKDEMVELADAEISRLEEGVK